MTPLINVTAPAPAWICCIGRVIKGIVQGQAPMDKSPSGTSVGAWTWPALGGTARKWRTGTGPGCPPPTEPPTRCGTRRCAPKRIGSGPGHDGDLNAGQCQIVPQTSMFCVLKTHGRLTLGWVYGTFQRKKGEKNNNCNGINKAK
jgi:hypothetical protein